MEEPKKSRKKELNKRTKELHVGERKNIILNLLIKNPYMTQISIAEELNLTRKQVQIAMRELQDDGLLAREGSNRKGRWIVKE